MTDRDLITRAMYEWEASGHDSPADAVMAALADRLLPELPEWAENVAVTLWRDQPDGRGPMKFITHRADGHGTTVPDAVRAALEADQ